MDSSRDNDRAECICEAHLEFIREYVRKENELTSQAIQRFLASKLRAIATALESPGA